MVFSSFYKRITAVVLISLSGNATINAQGTPVSASANSMVDLLTGDFQYSLPVMTVPGPNGENVPITFSYHGGIRMEEQSSWIGLGWNYNPGEISHSINGVSDDWNDKTIQSTKRISSSVIVRRSDYYGPIYYNAANYTDTNTTMDIATSTYKLPVGMFYEPAYDSYYASGPGISGKMEPRLFSSGNLYLKGQTSNANYPVGFSYDHSTWSSTKRTNFVFTNELNGAVEPLSTATGGYTGTYNGTANRVHTPTYVEYFTNTEINANPSGFMDYRVTSGTKRPSTSFDGSDIGAFRITNSSGLVYHYSLPVYAMENEQSTTFIQNGSNGVDGSKVLTENKKLNKTVVAWKLTAVTGPDYTDANSNGVVDIGDTGYWIAYNYGLWINNTGWRSPFYGYSPNQYNKKVRIDQNGTVVKPYNVFYGEDGTVSIGEKQSYYLNSIQTSTHTAYFIKDIRLDGFATDSVSGNFRPALKLSKIVLVKNENISLFNNSGTLSFGSFSSTGCMSSHIQPHIANYNANDVLIKANSLATVDLISDYSLCRYLYNNFNNSFTLTTNSWGGIQIYKAASSPSSSSYSNSGKLTLTEIKTFGPGYKSTGPSYLFDYDQSNSTKNPDFDPYKVDIWGYYKSDFNATNRCRYTTNASAANTDAWSLKKITTPLGGEILIEYESDNYRYSCSNNLYYASPVRIFPISSATYDAPNYRWQLTVNAGINDFISLSGVRKELGLPFWAVGCSDPNTHGANPVYEAGDPVLSLTATGSAGATQNYYATNTIWTCTPSGAPTYNNTYVNGYGYVKLTFDSIPGGGTRVKNITFKDAESNNSYINEYSYDRGVAGSEPMDMLVRTTYGSVERNNNAGDPLIPSPIVSYSKVTVRSKSLNNTYTGKTRYEYYNTYEQYIVNKATDVHTPGAYGGDIITANYNITKINGILNAPKCVTVYDNNDNIVRLTSYEYDRYSEKVPHVTEKYSVAQTLDDSPYDNIIQGTHIMTEEKARLKKKTDFFNGITTIEEDLDWDNITGEVTKKRITNATEGVTETIVEPAFRNSSYLDMGPKSIDNSYKNLTGNPYKVTVFKDKLIRNIYQELLPSGYPTLVRGTKTTWRQTYPLRVYNNGNSKYETQSTSSSIWKPYQSYSFNGNTDDTQWKYEGEATIYNARTNVIEAKNGDNRFVASKLGYNNQYTLCQASDAKYADFAFSGFEDQLTVATGVSHFGGEITHGEMRYAGDASIQPHSGKYMAKVDPGYGPGHFAKGFTPGRSYRASVWIHKNSPAAAALYVTLDGSTHSGAYSQTKSVAKSDANNITVGDWILISLTIDVPADYVESGGSLNDLRVYCNNAGSTPAYYDDLSVRPVDGTISGNVIDEATGRTLAVLDAYDFATRYVYDDAGRVREIWVESATEGWKLKQRYSYNFKRTY